MARIVCKYQTDSMDCGPACLSMVTQYHGKKIPPSFFRNNCQISREGTTLKGLTIAANLVGLRTLCAKITEKQLAENILLPCILLWDNCHYVVCYKIKGKKIKKFYICDPAEGKKVFDRKELREHWTIGTFEQKRVGIAMQIEPEEGFYTMHIESHFKKSVFQYFTRYIKPYRWRIIQLLFSTSVTMLLGYFIPFISQEIVDIGIIGKSISFVLLMIYAQLVIIASQTLIMFIQSWVSLHMNTVISIRMVSDYLKKLAFMPMCYFETRTMGDIIQRIGDHERIKSFLMDDLLEIVFSGTTFLTFAVVLGIYNWHILEVFLIGNGLYIFWIFLFMNSRRYLDNETFKQSAKLQNNMVQFMQGMQEIKLNNIEKQKCDEWEQLQISLYKISRKGLRLGQLQSAGTMMFSSTTNVLITYLTANLVINGEMTMGMLTSLSFIVGQVAGPIKSFIGFAQRYQNAKISLERLNDIQSQEPDLETKRVKESIPLKKDIIVENVKFSYNNDDQNLVLKDISLKIPENKVTAIVGKSGCGKTTLIKILQNLYQPISGSIYIGNVLLSDIEQRTWRNEFGSVMQDGYIFSDTIENNILMYSAKDKNRLSLAISLVNMTDFINHLPQGTQTKIGHDGLQLSQGQQQRILLARVFYKNPMVIFLDEATNALDAQNEQEIMKNIKNAFSNRTIIIAAHRLSTIQNADNIVVMDDGRIIEQGKHEQLISRKGFYYKLIQSQLRNIC